MKTPNKKSHKAPCHDPRGLYITVRGSQAGFDVRGPELVNPPTHRILMGGTVYFALHLAEIYGKLVGKRYHTHTYYICIYIYIYT